MFDEDGRVEICNEAGCECEASWLSELDGQPLCSVHYFDELETLDEGPWVDEDWRE